MYTKKYCEFCGRTLSKDLKCLNKKCTMSDALAKFDEKLKRERQREQEETPVRKRIRRLGKRIYG